MHIFRNEEIKQVSIVLTVITVLLSLVGFYISSLTGIMILITVFLLCATFLVFTKQRYKNLENLSVYLKKMIAGDYSMDIRDNAEGELSILKSEIYKVTLMLTEYNEQLRREKLFLSEHMAEISHQLKTPLTSMLVMIDLLQKEELPYEKRKEFTSRMSTQLERFEWLLSSLLKMSKLEAGVVEMKSEEIPVKKLVENAINPFLITMELKDITYSLTNSITKISCDIKWTTEAFMNIIKNCIEHTNNGGHLSLQCNENPLYTEIILTDNGTGISKEDLPHIFTRFYRGKNAAADSVGIGLAMSYRIIRSQQGDILVKSELGEGSSFFIRFHKTLI